MVMLLKFLAAPSQRVADTRNETKFVAPRLARTKKLVARPVKDPDYAALRKNIEAKFSKTLAYLAK